MHRRTEELGFVNVVAAFPQLPGGVVPVQYYEDRRADPNVHGLVLRDELYVAAQSFQAANLGLETDTRWRLVETAWSTGIAGGLLAPVLIHDAPTASLVVVTNRRRRSVAGVVGALSGYQDGRCAYCQEPMLLRGRGQEVVEHVLPWRLLGDRWAGPDLDALWNLVLACQPCNSAKHARAPSERWMEWLERRNNDLIASHHRLRQTLMAQTGQTIPQRHATLRRAYTLATELLPAVWEPPTILIR